MTIDKAKLKALANAATPGRVHDRLDSCGGGLKYECFGDDGSLVLKVDHKNDEWGFVGDNGAADEEFFLACTPAVVLALIAENDRIKSDNREMLKFKEHMVELRETHGFDSWAAALVEVDRLRVENDALRKDAERYRWLRSRESAEDPEISVTRWTQLTPQSAMGEAPRLEVLDAAIDAAMGKGEKS
ncbi:hypothetical protein [Pseudomonas sivasensis]|uniref:Uncharacterized protein n=1 Tax=Pseudomonas sivasensis TaxID=1880678 RepID=A0ABW8E547_9PSED